MMPWDEVERCYAESLSGSGMGAPAKSGRLAYGALLGKERLGLTDEETAEQVQENPYLQYFLGLEEFRDEPLFDPSTMVHFRSRFTQEHHRRINERIVALAAAGAASESPEYPKSEDKGDSLPPSGKLLVDATCAPDDVKYPTDLGLLDEAREKTESVIDAFHAHLRQQEQTYRRKARKQFLAVAKHKKPGARKVRKAIGQQLGCLRRNLGHIDRALDERPELLSSLGGYQYKCLLAVHELCRQQSSMHARRSRSVADRIVSISQPHVRPIVRGKAGRKVEFGAKLSISHQSQGYVTVDTLSWDAYNEGGDLPEQIERYKTRFGRYPANVHADGVYRTRANRSCCKERDIRLTGKPSWSSAQAFRRQRPGAEGSTQAGPRRRDRPHSRGRQVRQRQTKGDAGPLHGQACPCQRKRDPRGDRGAEPGHLAAGGPFLAAWRRLGSMRSLARRPERAAGRSHRQYAFPRAAPTSPNLKPSRFMPRLIQEALV